ncbi:MAG: PEP-CTERM sorting domain-containing protein [Planctomycetes bacterium]|nr:PEP-CTERM sorting domain-containing protein [Planctomycetota bacterium]
MRTFGIMVVVASALGLGASAHANLISNPGFEDFPNSITDSVLAEAGYYVGYTSPVTVDGSDPNFTGFIGTWAGTTAGNGMAVPVGAGNDSTRATGNRKAARYIQILPLGTISAGDQIKVDWQYGVAESYTASTGFVLEVFALNQAAAGEAPTTFTGTLGFGGEAVNTAILATQAVNLVYNAADPAHDDIDGLWHDAPGTIIDITEDWDYVGVAIRRTTGIGNSTAAQTDNISLTIVPEPTALSLLALAGLAGLRRRRAAR